MLKLITLLIVVLSRSLSFGQKIEVLNFDTFDISAITDARKVEFDQSTKKSKADTLYTLEKLKCINTPNYWDQSININAVGKN